MKRLFFRQPNPGLTDYAAVILVAVAFVATAILVVAPERFATTQNQLAQQASN
jgi:hypothetical protein